MSPAAPQSPIKILRVIDRLNIGGPAIHVILLTQHMNPSRPGLPSAFETRLVYGQEAPGEGNMFELARQTGVQPSFIPSLGRELNPLRDVASFWQLLRLIRRERPSVVHTHKSKAGVVGRLAARLCRVPVIIHTYHGHVLHSYFSPLKTRMFIAIERWMGKFSDQLIAVSPKVKDDLVRYGIASNEKIRVTYLGLDLRKFAEKRRGEGALRRQLGLAPGIPLVGIVARLVPVKDLPLFLSAAQALLARRPETRFVIAGDGELRGELEKQAQDRGLRERVYFLGFRSDVENIYSDLDVLMLTSFNEGSPVSLIEGLAAGCAVVATDVGGVSDVVHHGTTGVLVPREVRSPDFTAAALAAAAADLLTDPARRQRLGEAGRN